MPLSPADIVPHFPPVPSLICRLGLFYFNRPLRNLSSLFRYMRRNHFSFFFEMTTLKEVNKTTSYRKVTKIKSLGPPSQGCAMFP
jgi:hypothetical protein